MTSLLAGVLRFRLVVLAVAAGVLATAIVHLRGAPVDVLPEFTPPYAEIQTEALGLSADEVEQLITVPLEADLLNGVEGVELIRSQSMPGLSSVTLVFGAGTDVYRARQLVEERLTQAHALPNVSKPPTLLQPLSSSNRVLLVGLSSSELSPIEQSVIARWTMKPQLMGVPGVANVSVWGMRDHQLQVQVDPEQLRARGVTLSQVVTTAGNAQVVSPLSFLEASTPGTGGLIETPQQRLQVRHLIERIADPAALGQVPVQGTGGLLRLRDVAEVEVDHQPLIGDAVVQGGPGLVLAIEKFPGASTAAVTGGVEDALDRLRPGLSGLQVDTSLFRAEAYIQEAVDTLGLAGLLGAALMLGALAALRLRWRGLLTVAVAVPLSLGAAVLVLRLLGHTLNALLLVGLAAAAAVVVDEAVASADRVAARLRRPSVPQQGGPADQTRSAVADAVVTASAEVRRPLVYGSGVALLAVTPLAVLEGRAGAFLSPGRGGVRRRRPRRRGRRGDRDAGAARGAHAERGPVPERLARRRAAPRASRRRSARPRRPSAERGGAGAEPAACGRRGPPAPGGAARDAADGRDRGAARPGPGLRAHARRRAARGGDPGAGHPGGQRVRGAEGLRRRRPGHRPGPGAASRTSGTCSSTVRAAGTSGSGRWPTSGWARRPR